MSRMKSRAKKAVRFSLNNDRYIVDTLDPQGDKIKAFYYNPKKHAPYSDELHLRSGVLFRRLEKLERRLFKGNHKQRYHYYEISSLVLEIVLASQLNCRDVSISVRHPFKGKLLHKKTAIRDFTSLAFFVDDIERLLRNLYGGVEGADLANVLAAIRCAVEKLALYSLRDLYSEHSAAFTADIGAGRLLEPGYGVNTPMLRDGVEAAETLAARARRILKDPTGHSRYTVKFAKALRKYWPDLGAIGNIFPIARGDAIAILQMQGRHDPRRSGRVSAD